MKSIAVLLNPILALGLLLLVFTTCKNTTASEHELRRLTYDQMQEQLLQNKIVMPAELPYYDANMNLLTKATWKEKNENPIATTWFVNKENALVKVQQLDVPAAIKQLQEKPFLKELTTLNCADLKTVMARLEHRTSIKNTAASLNLLLKTQNVEALEYILKTCGFPTKETTGDSGMQTTWNVLQDASKETRSLYFPKVIEATKTGDLTREDVALMQDKLLRDYGKPQLYGTQLVLNDAGVYELYSLDKPAEVDARRAMMSMPPLQDYLDHFNIIWTSGSH